MRLPARSFGRVPPNGAADDWWSSWVNPTSILGGILAVGVCAYLASVYLIDDARRFDEPEMVEYFRTRAVGAAIGVGIVAFVGIWVLYSDADYLFHGLTSRVLPLVILSAICGLSSLVLLHRGNRPSWARPLAMAAVATVVIGWGVARVELHVADEHDSRAGRGPHNHARDRARRVHRGRVLLILPSIAWLYFLDQRGVLSGDTEAEAKA